MLAMVEKQVHILIIPQCKEKVHLKNCLAKESASLNTPCSEVSLKLRELVFPEEPSWRNMELPRRTLVGVLPGDGAPLRVKFSRSS